MRTRIEDNLKAGGIWSDGKYMYVGDRAGEAIHVYCLSGCS